ncbi:hypothetical protein C7S18_12045 [Ahniella affigens]|uniref:DUF4129 domain-containing protein n=1 Tax=Ahniella affigens TaxID=2021234 RepID=A0A2P1PSS0_9GAMM|nr:hypothetical protein [Ahniella affigens]AVP97883.1 hypothetical protein C7S18_12045 [Ahniella affigens]
MELDRISIRLRQRGGFESIDLGIRMAIKDWRPLWSIWSLCYLPLVAVLCYLLWDQPVLLVMAMYWIKPIPERFALHVLSRAMFGETVSVRAALRDWSEVLTPGLFAQLLWRRPFDWMRSFNTPVVQLERQTGAQAAERRRLLGMRFGSYALALQFVGFMFEWVLVFGFTMLVNLFLTPEGQDFGNSDAMFTPLDLIYIALAHATIGPFFVAAGFSLYLNRRVILEAWDVELNLKRLRSRVETMRAGNLAVLFALAASCSLLLVDPAMALSTKTPETKEKAEFVTTPPPLDTPAHREAVKIVSDKEFGDRKRDEVHRFRFHREPKKREYEPQSNWLGGVGEFLARVLQVLGWILLAVLIGAVIYLIVRLTGGLEQDIGSGKSGPKILFGLQIAPESLPDDIGQTALELIRQGQVREALSLIYRGALSHLVHVRKLRVSAGATESEVATLSKRVLGSASAAYFAEVLAHWIDIAYGGRLPDVQAITRLAERFAEHFGKVSEPVPAEVPA